MKSKTKLLAGILAAIFVAVVGITITLVVTGIQSGDQQTIVRNESDLRTAVTEESDKIIVLADDLKVEGNLEMTQLRNFDLNGHTLTVTGTFTVKSSQKSKLWFGHDGEGSSDGGTLAASKVNVDAPNAHIDWNGDVKLSGSGADAFTVRTSGDTFVMNGKFVGADNKTVAAPELTVKGGSLQLAADVTAVTYTVHVDADNPKVENKTNGEVVVKTARPVTVGGSITVEGSSADVVVTASASASVTVQGTVGAVKAKDADVVVDTAATADSVEAKTVVNKGTTGQVKASGEVKNEEGATVGKIEESGSVVNNGTVTESVKSNGKVENAGEVRGSVEASEVENKEDAKIGGDISASGKVENNGTVEGGVEAGEVTGDGEIKGDVTVNEKTIVAVPDVQPETTLTYNGSEQGIAIPDNKGYTITGAQKSTNVGTYTVTVTLNTDYIWSDETTAAKTYTYTINKADNAWTTEYSTANYTYGTAPTTTAAVAKFGTANAAYYSDSACSQPIAGMNGFTNTTDAGTYYVKVSVADTTNYKELSKVYTVVVAQAEVEKPTLTSDNFAYDSTEHTVFPAPANAKYSVSGNKATEAGSYKVTFKLNDTKNYKWKGGDSKDFTIDWTITQATNKWTAQVETDNYTYGQTPTAADFQATFGNVVFTYYSDSDYKNEIKDFAGFTDTTTAGTYYVKVTVADDKNYTGLEVKYSVTVSPKKVTVPEVTATTFTYDGSEHGIDIADNDGYIIDGALKNKDAGTYTVTVTLNDNYVWSDDSTDVKSFTYTINQVKVTVPTFENGKTLSYNGAEQEVFDAPTDALYTVTDYKGTAVGKHTIKFELNDTKNYVWDDNTADAKTYDWEIVPGTATVTSEDELVNAFADDGYDKIVLGSNVDVTKTIIIERKVTLDLAGKTITNNGKGIAFCVSGENAILTLNDKSNAGGIYGGKGGDNMALFADGGATLNINGGNYSVGADANGLGNSCIGSGSNSGNGYVNIYGGKFSTEAAYNNWYYVLNVLQTQGADGVIKVYGGEFINYNPADGDDNLGGNFVAEGYKVAYTDATKSYVVVKSDVTCEGADIVYNYTSDDVNAEVYTAKGFGLAITKVSQVTLMSNIDADGADFNKATNVADGKLTVDLNSKTLTLTGGSKGTTVMVENGFNLTVKNGNLVANNATVAKACFNVTSKSTINFENVNVESTGVVLYPRGDAAAVNVVGCSIKTNGGYGIATNADNETHYGVSINIEKSTVDVTYDDGDAAAVMINVAGKLHITDSTIKSTRQGVVVRAGTATIENTEIDVNLTYTGGVDKADPAKWGSGNNVAYGALVVGNNTSNSYNADAIVSMTGGSLNCTTSLDALKDHTNALYAVRLNSETYKTTVALNGTSITGNVFNYGNTATVTGLPANVTVINAYVNSVDTLKKALEYGGNIRLIGKTADLEVGDTSIEINRDAVIDLGGHTVTATLGKPAFVITSGDVIIQNGTIKCVNATPNSTAPRLIEAKNAAAKLILNDITATSTAYGIGVFTNARVELNRCDITVDWSLLTTNNRTGGAVIVVNDSKLKSTDDVAIYMSCYTDLTLNNTEVTGKTAVDFRVGKLTVKGGSLISTTTHDKLAYKDVTFANGTYEAGEGSAILVRANFYYDSNVKTNRAEINVSDTTKISGALSVYDLHGIGDMLADGAIDQIAALKTFIENFNDTKYLYEVNATNEAVYEVDAFGAGNTAEAATAGELESALDAGYNVTLLNNITANVVIAENASAKLDLNGYTLTGTVYNNGTLTITGNGKVVAPTDHAVVNKGILTVENGTFDAQANVKAALYNEGTATLNGGTFDRSKEAGTRRPDSSDGGNSYYYIFNYGVMTINDGAVVESKSASSSAVNNCGVQNTDKTIRYAELTINGGKFSSYGITLKNDEYGKLIVNGGTFSVKADESINNGGGSEVVLNWVKADINGGTFTNEMNGVNDRIIYNLAYPLDGEQNNLTIGGTAKILAGKGRVAIYSESYGDFGASPVLNVTGGAIEGSITVKSGKFDVSGGTFTSHNEAVAYLLEGSVAEISAGSFAYTRDVGRNTNMIEVNNSKLAITGGTFESAGYGFAVVNNASLDYDGATTTADWPCVSGNNQTPTTDVTIRGGSLTSREDATVYMPSAGTLTITGGTLTGPSVLDIRMGNANVSIEGTAKLIANKSVWTPLTLAQTSGATKADGSAVILNTNRYNSNTAVDPYLNITIGNTAEITATSGRLITVYDWNQVEQKVTANFGKYADDAKYYGYSNGSLIETDSEGTALVANAADFMNSLGGGVFATIKLTDNIELTPEQSQTNITDSVIIDLNGKTLSGTSPAALLRIAPKTGATVAIKNGSIINTNETDGYALFPRTDETANTGTVVLDHLTVSAAYGSLYTNGTHRGLTIKATACVFDNDGAYLAGNHTYSFTDCKFSGSTGVYIKSGTATFTDCDIESTAAAGEYFAPVYDNNGSDSCGSALVIDSCAGGYQSPLNVTIKGGSLKGSADGYDLEVARTAASEAAKIDYIGKVDITGCAFTKCAIDSALTPKVVYHVATEAELLALTEVKGLTVVLEKDITFTADGLKVLAGSEMVLDLNGHTLTSDKAVTATVANYGTLTVINSVAESGGITRGTATKWYTVLNEGALTIENNVNIYNNNTVDTSSLVANNVSCNKVNPATLMINGGTYVSKGSNAVKNDEYGVLTINGGTFTTDGGRFAAVQNWATATINGGTFTGNVQSVSVMAYRDQTNKTVINGGTFEDPTSLIMRNGYVEPSLGYNFGKGKIELVITGGTFKGRITEHDTDRLAETDKISISDGTFVQELDELWIADGSACVRDAENAYSVVPIYEDDGTNFALLAMSDSVRYIRLTKDVTIPKQVEITTRTKSLIVDLGGHTVTANVSGATGSYEDYNNRGLYITKGDITIINGTLAASADCNGVIYIGRDVNLTLEDVTMTSSKADRGNVYLASGSNATFRNVTANAAGGSPVFINGGIATFENCTFTQTGGSGYFANVINVANGGTANVVSGTYNGGTYGFYVYNSGGTINVRGGTVGANTAALKADKSTNQGNVSVINLYGGTVNGGADIADGAELNVLGDINGDLTPTATTTISVSDAAGLRGVSSLVNSAATPFKGKIVLTKDIDLNGEAFTPIGKTKGFAGTFDGQGHTISNLSIDVTSAAADAELAAIASAGDKEAAKKAFDDKYQFTGFIAKLLDPGSIVNLNFNNAKVKGYSSVGVIVGGYTGTISNCNVTGLVQVEGNYKVGGITGDSYAKITECSVIGDEGSYVKGTYAAEDYEGDNVGGIVGFTGEGDGTYSKLVAQIDVYGTRKVGGLFGYLHYGKNVENSTYAGTVYGNSSVDYKDGGADNDLFLGGIAGEYSGDKAQTGNVISGCEVTVKFVSLNDGVTNTVGGIVGGTRNDASKLTVTNNSGTWTYKGVTAEISGGGR